MNKEEKTKYVPWTDKERELVRHLIDVAVSQGKNKGEAAEFASKKLGRSATACLGAYYYIPVKKDLPQVEEQEEEVIEEVVTPVVEPQEKTLKLTVHNDVNNECLTIKVNDSVTILKIGDIIVTLEV
jgi:hypothetical protein